MKFVERNIIDFKKTIKNIFDLMTIEGKYKVIGSSNLKNVLYNSDYDLAEFDEFKSLKSGQEYIYHRFKDIFKKAESNKNVFITDFKCGVDSDNEPLRWNKKDIEKGFKTLKNGKKQSFNDSLIDKDNTIKIDIVSLIDGVFVEFSENLYFKFGEGKTAITNYIPSDITKPKILASIKADFFDKLKDGKPFKALKRKFAYYKLLDTDKYKNLLNTLLNFFNSPVGIVAKAHADLDTIILVMESSDKVKIEDVVNNIQNIKQNLSYTPDLENVSEKLNKICSLKTKQQIIKQLNIFNTDLYKYITYKTEQEFEKEKYSKNKI